MPRLPGFPQLPAADPLAGPGRFQQPLLLPVAQPVLRRCRRDGKPLLQVAGPELGSFGLSGGHTRAQARQQLLAAAIQPFPGMGIRSVLPGLQALRSGGQINRGLADHLAEIAEPGGVIRVVAAFVEVHGAAQLQCRVVALPIRGKPLLEAQESTEGVAAAPQRCRGQQAPAAAIAIREGVDGDEAGLGGA